MSQKNIFDELVVMRKNKPILTLDKLAYVGMHYFDLSKVLMYKLIMNTLKLNMAITQGCY